MREGRTTHPSLQQLADYGLGKLAEEQMSKIASHLESCPDCRHKVEEQAPDMFIGQIRVSSGKGGTMLPAPAPGASLSDTALPNRGATTSKATHSVPAELVGSGKFEILSKLGEGGMGAVYKARHTYLGEQVAVKVLSPAALGNNQVRDRFLTEMRAVGKLKHPNIVRAMDADCVGNLLVLVMEYVEGLSLDRLVAQKGPLPIGFACHWIAQTAQGLQHAHEKGMVHRDIKPANLMVTREEKEIKILDFGLARLPRELAAKQNQTQLQAFMGTPEYVAPEQSTDARSVDIRADIYSLGCTLYYLLAGRPPFRADSAVATILAHIEKEPTPLTELRPEVPADLWAVVARMLAKKPEDRYQTPADVARALQQFARTGAKAASVNVSVPPPPLSAPDGGRADTAETAPFAAVGGIETEADRKPGRRRQGRPGGDSRWMLLVGCVLGGLLTLLGTWLALRRPASVGEETNDKKTRLTGKLEEKTAEWPREITNSIGMKLIRIPAGKFTMGSPQEESRSTDEQQHEVEITSDFWLGVYEVTQQEYQKVMGYNPSYFSGRGGGKGRVAGMDTRRFPVESVNWTDAQEFCDKLTARAAEQKMSRKYRLPTEAEWEYACRGGASAYQVFHCGTSLSSSQANFNGNFPFGGGEKGPYLQRTCRVGLYKPNGFGLFDMHGNVWEWCFDWFADDYYGNSPLKNPDGPSARSRRVIRGGCFADVGQSCRSANRGMLLPRFRSQIYGFRVVLVPFRY